MITIRRFPPVKASVPLVSTGTCIALTKPLTKILQLFFYLFQVMLTELEEKVTGLEKTLRLSEYKVWLVFVKNFFFFGLAFLVCCFAVGFVVKL
jgi:hypothetical protein